MIGQDLIDRFEQFASPQLAESWDNVGLQLGDPTRPVHRIMTTLDVRPIVVQEAIEQGVDFILAHHPMMFHPAVTLDLRDPQNAMYAQLIEHGITVYAAHTNLDNANGGMNDWLATQLGLQATVPLLDGGIDPNSQLPYGMGRIGNLAQPLSALAFARHCQQVFGVPGLRYVDDQQPKVIQRVAVLGGSGGEFYSNAVAAGADAYVTGDVSYHVGHDMLAHGLMVVDPGHHIESICKAQLKTLFEQWRQEDGWDVAIYQSTHNTDPFTFMV